jgi:arylsulfatase A-like enzyme
VLCRAWDARLPRERTAGPGASAGAGRPAGIGRLRAALVICGYAGLALALSVRVALPYARASRAAGRPPVILVSIDTLRADRLGAYGSDRGLTPRLDALAREGAVFEEATATAPWTLPSHVSLFTSMLPFDHHVRWTRTHIDPVRSMLAERFRDAGYRTAAFTGAGYVDSVFGFDQGFEIYENHREVDEGGPARIVDHALGWARAHANEPFFMFVHTYEVHSPFTNTTRAPHEDAGRLHAPFTNREVEEVHQQRLVLTPAERRYVTGLYDSDVASADSVIGALLETLRRDGILDRAIVVILSDHGEDLWDHDARWSPGHGHTLYQELVRVPLIVRAPGLVPAGARFRTPVSLLDVAPTLLEMTGLPPEPDHRGRSLDAALRSGREPEVRPVWSESVEFGPDRFAVREGDRKLIRTPRPGIMHSDARFVAAPLEVFDLAADPNERRDLSGSLTPPEVRLVVDVEHRAERALHASSAELTGAEDLPENLHEQLRSLGYVK